MAALATQFDVESELGRVLTSEERDKVNAALERASDFVRSETRRKFEAGTYTVIRRARGGKVRLDSPASVSGVVAVDSLGTPSDVTGWTLRGNTLYGLGYATDVEVTYTSDGVVPDELVRVVAAMAARDITDERPQGATSYTIARGPFTESATYEDDTDSVMPTASEARTISRYKYSSGRSVSLI